MRVALAFAAACVAAVEGVDRRQCPTKILSWQQYLDEQPLKCEWNHETNSAVPSRCDGLGQSACAAARDCTQWMWEDLTCGPAVPMMVCQRRSRADCERGEYDEYCDWSSEGCRPIWEGGWSHYWADYNCELYTREGECRDEGCSWQTHPSGHFKWCTHSSETRCVDSNPATKHMCREP
eukprot:TRINITY_DN14518_c0_g1_i1.p2 TRINITY_DN14518_c0_g1~~TRINITY_DN14518_c0_g1_i1.p2  ORF type:complete len:179 (+),score=40.42 TRINITY_DN14518_c0_g1_i1:71-607(+)